MSGEARCLWKNATRRAGSQQELLVPVVKAIKGAMEDAHSLITNISLITADAGYHSESNLKQLAGLNIDALIADNGMRQRDERFKDRDKHKRSPDTLYDKSGKQKEKKASHRRSWVASRCRRVMRWDSFALRSGSMAC